MIFPIHLLSLGSKHLLLFAIIILISISIAHPAEITVCLEGCDFSNIASAVDASQPGDVLGIQSGIYPENIVVNKSITLKGVNTGAGLPEVDGHSRESTITLKADGINLSGFSLRGAKDSFELKYAAINVLSNSNIIEGNSIFNNENGILLKGSDNIVERNNITNNYYGIRLETSDNNNVQSNYLGINTKGFYAISSQSNDISNNTAAYNMYGIILEISTDNFLKHNKIIKNHVNFGADGDNNITSDNLVDGRPIIYLVGLSASDKIIDSSSKAGTVYCINCSNVTIKDLMIDNNANGIYLYNTTNSVVENNTLVYNDDGLILIGSSMNVIKDNTFENNNIEGLSLVSSDYNTLENNKALNNSNMGSNIGASGISLLDSDQNRVAMNDVRGNPHGLSLNDSNGCVVSGNDINRNSRSGVLIFHSNNSTIQDNEIHNNPNGIWFAYAHMNIISANDISNNKNGVLLYFSQNNTIIENNFNSNTAGIAYDPKYINALGPNNMTNNTNNTADIVSNPVARPPGAGVFKPQKTATEKKADDKKKPGHQVQGGSDSRKP
jgi:parallel beta-helix repeat protein